MSPSARGCADGDMLACVVVVGSALAGVAPVAEVQTLTTNHNNPRQNLGGQNGGDEGRDMFVTFAVVSTGWFPPG